jgi:peptide-methionine (R)-S-oxide reductase
VKSASKHIPAALLFLFVMLFGLIACSHAQDSKNIEIKTKPMTVNKTDDEWKKELTPMQFNVLRLKGTERPFTGEYDEFFEEGDYYCAACGALLFHSSAKYNSGCGWPAFFEPADSANMIFKRDLSHGMVRTEVMCANCGSHLGHVFDDGPKPTGVRYCINSVSLVFKPSKEKEKQK